MEAQCFAMRYFFSEDWWFNPGGCPHVVSLDKKTLFGSALLLSLSLSLCPSSCVNR